VTGQAGELRFDPLTRQWVNIVGHRQSRPNLPTGECPFCVGGLEAPDPYDTRWFPNRWPPYEPGPPIDALVLDGAPSDGTAPVLPAVGAAEVVLYSPRHEGSLGSLGEAQIRKVVDLWAERTAALMARPEVEYVLVFESRGSEVGATIHHPHGQIYALGFVPPAPAAEGAAAAEHGDVVAAELAAEVADGRRVVFDDGEWAAWVPFASGFPYGLRIAPRTKVGRIDELDPIGRDGLAAALADVLGRYDRLWRDDPAASPIFPYLMWLHQAPKRDAELHHLHVHLAPPQRAPGVLRFVAAGESGSGTLSNPVVPEAAAAELRAV
jgi:UDPglucose--hexose-1-phosphate uridylyltransferase